MGDITKRCRHCGGTMWNDGTTLKCLMCSRSPGDPIVQASAALKVGNPKFPVYRNPSSVGKSKK